MQPIYFQFIYQPLNGTAASTSLVPLTTVTTTTQSPTTVLTPLKIFLCGFPAASPCSFNQSAANISCVAVNSPCVALDPSFAAGYALVKSKAAAGFWTYSYELFSDSVCTLPLLGVALGESNLTTGQCSKLYVNGAEIATTFAFFTSCPMCIDYGRTSKLSRLQTLSLTKPVSRCVLVMRGRVRDTDTGRVFLHARWADSGDCNAFR